jgi:hypothetical protein
MNQNKTINKNILLLFYFLFLTIKTMYIDNLLRSFHKNNRLQLETSKQVLKWSTTAPIHIDKWLLWNFYNKTNKICTRDMIFNPSSLFYGSLDLTHIDCSFIYGGILNGIYFNKNSTSLNEVINLSPFAAEHGDIFDLIFSNTSLASLNFPLISDLFENIFARQHRVGFIIKGSYSVNENFTLYSQIPFLYSICHMYADSETQERLSDELYVLNNSRDEDTSDTSDYDFSEDFIKKHAVSDMFGIERALVGFSYGNFEKYPHTFHLRIVTPGLLFSQGIIGSDLNKISHKFDNNFKLSKFLSNIINANLASTYNASEQEIIDEKQDFLGLVSSMFMNINDGVLNVPFNKKPWGLAPACSFIFDFNNDFSINCFLQYMYQFPFDDYRYGSVQSPKSLPTYNDNLTESQAANILNIYDNEFLYRAILYPFLASVQPGYEIQGNFMFLCNTHPLTISFGYDLWYRSAEKINEIKTLVPKNIFYSVPQEAFQGKLCGGIDYAKEIKNTLFSIFAKGDVTLFSSGIGKEFSINIGFQIIF